MRLLTRLKRATCRGMPGTINLHHEKPNVEIIRWGPGAQLMEISVTRDMVTVARRAYDYYQWGRAGALIASSRRPIRSSGRCWN